MEADGSWGKETFLEKQVQTCMEADGGAAKNSMEAVEEQETTNNQQEAAGPIMRGSCPEGWQWWMVDKGSAAKNSMGDSMEEKGHTELINLYISIYTWIIY